MTTETPASAPQPSAPVAARHPKHREFHGDGFDDPYEWMREKESDAVVAHLEAENAYTQARLAHLDGLRGTIFDEIKARIQESDLSVPVRRGDWWYYTRSIEGKQYGVHCRAPIGGPDDWTPPTLAVDTEISGEQVLLDSNVEAEGHEFFSLGAFSVTPDGERMLWGTDVQGDERYTVRVREIVTGNELPDVLEGISAGARFTPDGTGIVYSTVDDAWRPEKVWLHPLGTAGREDDILLRHEADEKFWLGAGYTRSEAFLILESGSKTTNETVVIRADEVGEPDAGRVPLWDRSAKVEYSVDHAVIDGVDWLYVVHNSGARDFELARVRVDAADPIAELEVVIAHEEGTRLDEVSCFRDFAVVEYRQGGIPRTAVLDYATGTLNEITFDEPLFAASAAGNPEWAQPVIRLGYGSFVTPGTILSYTVSTGEREVLKQTPVLGGYDPADYDQRRIWVAATDGTEIPVSLVWKRSFGEPGTSIRPVHLYGYGSYEASMDPSFSPMRLSELDRGVVFAVAHVRGGGEMGRSWYEQGKLAHKRNTFTDFVDVARHLVDAGYTSPERMVAEGGSAGGLLMGAVANLAPELFAGILAVVPFVDALTTILDPSLPLTVTEWEEWGDPLHDAAVYEYMKSYSPYENVREGVTYPRVLAMTSYNDTRVAYVEPAKWVARLREVGADALMHCEMVAGHGGVSGRYDSWKERAFELAWMFDVLGLAA